MAGEIHYVVAWDGQGKHLVASEALTDYRKALEVSLEKEDFVTGAVILTLFAGEVITVNCKCGKDFTLSNPPSDISQAFRSV